LDTNKKTAGDNLTEPALPASLSRRGSEISIRKNKKGDDLSEERKSEVNEAEDKQSKKKTYEPF
jgi:hypothetical protein